MADPTAPEEPAPAAEEPAPATEEPAAEPTPAPGPRSGPQILVEEHNRYRAQHCAPPLTWSPKLAASAQAWADHLRKAGCMFGHSGTDYGENLAAGTAGALSPQSVVEMWYREVDAYDYRAADFSPKTGHFTQLVWAGTARVGCGTTSCKGLEIWVCQYDPPGNVVGEFGRNVKPTSCR